MSIGEGAIGEFAISEGAAAWFGAGTVGIGESVAVAVAFDFYDETDAVVKTLRKCSSRMPLIATVGGVRTPFKPGLIIPDGGIKLGYQIEVQGYGSQPRGVASGGVIEFIVDDDTLSYLSYAHIGRRFDLYQGPLPDLGDATDRILDFGDPWATMQLVYVGRMTGLSYDDTTRIARVSTTDARVDLDNPVVNDFYDDTAPLPLQGRPKPYLWGERYSIDPAVEDPATEKRRISSGALNSILAVRVGGVVWTPVPSGATPGQYTVDLPGGTFTLGGTPEGGEVRVDARAADYATLSTAQLVRALVTAAGGTVDETRLTELQTAEPVLIGYSTGTDPINRQDVLDQIMAGILGWWAGTPLGSIAAGVIRAPGPPPCMTLTPLHIERIELVATIPPAYRIRSEYKPNASPATQWFTSVTAEEQQAQAATGIITPTAPSEATADAIKLIHPRAVDLPLIRTFTLNLTDGVEIRDHATTAFTVARQIWSVTAYMPLHPDLFSVVEIDHPALGAAARMFRVIGVVRAFGGGPSTIQLWG